MLYPFVFTEFRTQNRFTLLLELLHVHDKAAVYRASSL